MKVELTEIIKIIEEEIKFAKVVNTQMALGMAQIKTQLLNIYKEQTK